MSRTHGRGRLPEAPVAAVVLAAMMTGAAPVLTKFILRHLNVESVLIWRYLLALLPVALVAAVRAPRIQQMPIAPRKLSLMSHTSLAVVAIFGSGASALLFTGSLLYAPAAVSNALSKAGPLLVAFLAYVWLQEPVSLGSLSMVAAMLLAAGLLGAGEFSASTAVSGHAAAGVGMAVAAGLMRASSEVAAKAALATWQPVAVASARFLGGVVLAAGAAVLRRQPLIFPEGLAEWTALLALASVCTALPIWLYYSGMAKLPVHHAAGLRTAGTAVTAIASWLVLGERLGSLHLLGLGALLLAAYAMAHMPAEGAARRAPLPRLSGKLVSFVAAVVAASILLAGALQACQLHALLTREVEASLSRAAALIGHVVSIQQVPAPVLRRYFDSLVREQMSGPGYRAEFSYIILADQAGVPLAWAFRRDDWPSDACLLYTS
ncbi:MAG: DMT family transporter, partial [Armatimonadetes bacterium]|nr:DMT family transporter [Armatimonadota bacterium]